MDIGAPDLDNGEAEYQSLVENQIGVTGGTLRITTERLQETKLHAENKETNPHSNSC